MDIKRVERVYSNFSGFYDIVFGKISHGGRAIAVKHLDIKPGDRILEVGIGTGLSLEFYPEDCKIVGIDLCGSMLEKGKKRVKKYNLKNVHLKKMDACSLSFADNSFDAILAAYVISVVPNPHKVLAEMTRVCKDKGSIILLNHFTNGNRIISQIERAVSPLCTRIGFRTDIAIGPLLKGTPLEIIKKESVKPLKLWKVVKCRNKKRGIRFF
ncbi:MAG: class I SAM-dependent methyltransferase [Nitrospirota bacterium]